MFQFISLELFNTSIPKIMNINCGEFKNEINIFFKYEEKLLISISTILHTLIDLYYYFYIFESIKDFLN